MEAFNNAFKSLLKNEGVYSFAKNDPGGETKFGISKRSYPHIDIRELTLDRAKEIYYDDFWQKWRMDEFSDAMISTKLFDMCVNMGINQTAICLQRALRSALGEYVEEDGVIGSKTIAAANRAPPGELLASLKSECACFYRLLASTKPDLSVFLKGWLKRAYG